MRDEVPRALAAECPPTGGPLQAHRKHPGGPLDLDGRKHGLRVFGKSPSYPWGNLMLLWHQRLEFQPGGSVTSAPGTGLI